VTDAEPDLRPRGVGEVLDAAVAVFRARPRPMLALTAVVVVPVQAFGLLVTLSTSPDGVDRTLTGAQAPSYGTDDLWLGLAGTLVVTLAGFLSTSFATAAVTRVVADAYLGGADAETRTSAYARATSRRLLPVLGLGLLTGVLTTLGTLLCVVPGLWLQVSWCVAMPVLLLEGTTIRAAMSRSMELTRPRWWGSAGVFYVGAALTGVVTLALSVPFGAAFGALGDGVAATLVAESAANTISSIVTTPFVAAALVVLYVDLRIRGEGFDVLLLVHRLGPPPTATARGPASS
jgi:hypothetical protein